MLTLYLKKDSLIGRNIKGKLLMTAIRLKNHILQPTPDISCISIMHKTVDNI